MGLNGLLDIELSVPNPQELNDFWLRRGLVQTSDGVLGTVDRAVQARWAGEAAAQSPAGGGSEFVAPLRWYIP